MHLNGDLIVEKEIQDSFRVSKLSNAAFSGGIPVSVIYNRMFILTEAKGKLQIDYQDYAIAGREIFLVSKGQVFSFAGNTELNGFEILFGDCFWEKAPASASNCKAVVFGSATIHPRMPIDVSEAADLLPVCEMLLKESVRADYPNKLDAMAAYLKIVMIKVANFRTSSNRVVNDFDNQLYQDFLELVSARFRTSREVADFAKDLSVPARKLSDVCRQKSGHGAKEIINRYLIAEAKRSLQFSAKPVKQIAYDLSFATPEQFSHFFKKNTKASPADYRDIFVNIGR